MSTYHRTQILLKPEQHSFLSQQAHKSEQSVSALVREIIDNYHEYKSVEAIKEQLRQERLNALEHLSEFRQAFSQQANEPLPDPVEILNKLREERMSDFEAIWQAER